VKRILTIRLAIAVGVTALTLVTCAVAAGNVSRSRFPPSVYPPPTSFPRWGLPIGCPSLDGVPRLEQANLRSMLAVLGRFGEVSETTDLRASDRALWRVIRKDWSVARHRRGVVHLSNRAVVSGPGADSRYAALVRTNCGRPTLASSWAISVCPFDPHRSRTCTARESPALMSHFLFLRRHGHWLVWFAYP
jgi:hypothetical protein